ncbi:MAG: L,D-transpeptidase family protein [Methyloceanibacter sp.]|nr:L,D-transpeptidase family protein [Methyloceanibacter sp.]
MRRRSLVAALVAVASAILCGALTPVPASAEDGPAAIKAAGPNAGAPDAADQQPATPTEAAPDDAQPAASPTAVTPVQTTPQPVAATPVVAAIRATLADPAFRKGASADDIGVLQAFYDEQSDPLWMTDMGFSGEALAVIDEVLKADDWGLSSAAFTLPPAGDLPASVDAAAASEIKLDLAILKYARYARGGRADPAKLSKLIGETPSLRDPKTVLSEIAAAEAPDAYLRSLHPKHEQFQRLHQALLKARAESGAGANATNAQRIIVNMERWRWMPEDLGSLYVWLNIPAFTVHVVKEGKPIYSDKIVVGEMKYATPVFSADLKSVVFNPEWTVPPTIVRENLLPSLRGGGGWFGGGNTAILDQHELKVNYNGKRVDPSSIDWNHVNMGAISFVQAPGPNNVLGKVKFVYPNPYSVYMHDTIKEGLFDKDSRAEGHNCPRVFKPGKIAAVILAADQNMPQAQVDKLLADGYNSAINVQHHIPVHTAYFTAVVNDDGKVETFADIYKLDGVIAAAILGKDAKADAVADNAQAKAKPQADAPAGGAAGGFAYSTP